MSSLIARAQSKLRLLPIAKIAIQRRMTSQAKYVKYLTQDEAINLDRDLFNEYAFSVDQLMELAGLAVATAITKSYPVTDHDKVLICCGPGNNGGDGLVCARHLKLFGYSPVVICPKSGKSQLYQNLLTQCDKFGIPISTILYSDHKREAKLIVDAVFGFSFKPPNRSTDFANLLNAIEDLSKTCPLVSVDIPSGWHVEEGPINTGFDQIETELRIPTLSPDCLISLTAPKICAKHFNGRFHYLGGRFCPKSILEKYALNLPEYPNAEGVVLLK